MPRDEWITSTEAARIMTENSGHEVRPLYVRQLALAGKIRVKAIDKRTNLYLKRDVAGYVVQAKRKPTKQEQESETSKS